MKTVRFLLAASAVALVVSCSKPAPPQLTPKEVKVTSVDLTGFDLRVKVDAFNPNAVALGVQSVVAHVIVDGTQDLGTVTSSSPLSLPANAHTLLDVPLTVKWKNVAALASVAAAKRSVPFAVDGTATVGGERLNVDLPFKLEGVITQEQLAQATVKSLQGLQIPGLVGPR